MATKERHGFVLYHTIRKPLKLLDDAQRGRLFMAILNYSENQEEPDFDDAALDIAFAFIRQNLDDSAEAWEETRRKRAVSGSIGGKQRAANQANASDFKQSQANQANASTSKQSQANASNPSKSSKLELEIEYELEKELEKELEDKKTKRVISFTPPTLEEVQAYCKERNSPVDAQKFFDYFTAGGWKDAKGNPVRNWKQKLLTWEQYQAQPVTAQPKTTGNPFLRLLEQEGLK